MGRRNALVKAVAGLMILGGVAAETGAGAEEKAAMRKPWAAESATEKQITNSIAMRLVRIEPGAFRMGGDGDFDERPVHDVKITRPFYLGACEVTNAQYERFDPDHRKLRGQDAVSSADDEPVAFVSWHDARRFCEWLAAAEGLPYRLPTEAEWEYACRAGTTTKFSAGDELPAECLGRSTRAVGKPAPNAWGLHDMHGNVEEWCHDWHGPYEAAAQTDPVGRADGLFRATRGGSHSTTAYYLRSANRSGALPEDMHGRIGFRVALGAMPETAPLPAPPPEAYQRGVNPAPPADATRGPDPKTPWFKGPRTFVRIPPGSRGPLFSQHNHDPAITECANGDLLAIWYTTETEPGRELAQAAARLRHGAEEWDPASPFLDTPDRNDHAPALWFDGKDTIYHFWGMSPGAGYSRLVLCMRTSKDNGVTWSRPRIIAPGYSSRKQPAESVFRAQDRQIALACDANDARGTTLWMSRDDGQSWYDSGGNIQGIHACAAQLKDGRLLAFGRGGAIEGNAPQSVSQDMGKTWTVSKSPFPAYGTGRRAVLLRLKEGPLLFASLAIVSSSPIEVTYADGSKRRVLGIYTALSDDEGRTWRAFKRVNLHGSGYAYLSACQGLNGVIHLITSHEHYAFNVAWLEAPQEPPPQALPARQTLSAFYEPKAMPSQAIPAWEYDAPGKESDWAAVGADGALTLKTPRDQYARWISRSPDGFGGADASRGCTAEVSVQVLRTGVSKSFDFEVCTGEGRYYHLNIADDRVTWCDGDRLCLVAMAAGSSSDRLHVYRIAVRPDGFAQVYRDGKLLDIIPPADKPASAAGEDRPPKGPYLRWGKSIGTVKLLDARIGHVAFDVSGAYQPEEARTGGR